MVEAVLSFTARGERSLGRTRLAAADSAAPSSSSSANVLASQAFQGGGSQGSSLNMGTSSLFVCLLSLVLLKCI